MLSKDICKRCYERQGYIWEVSWIRGVRFPRHHDAEKYWKKESAVKCPCRHKDDPEGYKPIAGKFSIEGNPPEHCVYAMEHIIATGHYDPKLPIENIPPMEAEW